MKKTIFILLLFFTSFCYSDDKKENSFAGISSGYSWFHNYSGYSNHGMNFSLYYEPSITKSINIDNVLSFHFFHYENNDSDIPSKMLMKYYLSPQVSIGPRYSIYFQNNFSISAGTGISFATGIKLYEESREAKADISPGFYIRTGLSYVFINFIGLGLELKYHWNVVHIPNTISLNIVLKLQF